MSAHKYSSLDLLFWSDGDGWSSVVWKVENVVERLSITHVFNDPYLEIARATVELVEGRDSSVFLWFDEPGTYEITLTRVGQSPTLQGTVREFGELHLQRVPEQAEPLRAMHFVTHLTYWSTLVHTSLSRMRELSRHSLYSSWSSVELPMREISVLDAYLHRERTHSGVRMDE